VALGGLCDKKSHCGGRRRRWRRKERQEAEGEEE